MKNLIRTIGRFFWSVSYGMRVLTDPVDTLEGWKYEVEPCTIRYHVFFIRIWSRKIKDPKKFSIELYWKYYEKNDIFVGDRIHYENMISRHS